MDLSDFSTISFLAMFVIALLSAVPVDLRRGIRVVALYYPILTLLVVIMYEIRIRAEISLEDVPIRIDLLILKPLLTFILCMGITRWVLVVVGKRRKLPEMPASGRLAQAIAGLFWGAICFSWFAINWWW